jgi:hypothetical protein
MAESCSKAFSTTTTEPSTISPMAMASPPSDIRLAESPTWFITMNVTSGVSTSVATTMSARAQVAEEQEQHDDDEDDALDQHLDHGGERGVDQFAAVVVGHDLQAVRQHARSLISATRFFTRTRPFALPPAIIITMPPTASVVPFFTSAPTRTACRSTSATSRM